VLFRSVSVENQDCAWRIECLRRTVAKVKFLSLEPLLGPLPCLDLQGIQWVIVGGESGPKARPLSPAWVLDIRDQCHRAGVPFFFKQWGGRNKKKAGRLLEGRTWDEMPSAGCAAV
jgi:protein gp37